MNHRHQLRNGVFASAGGTLLAALVLWILGKLSAAMALVGKAGSAVIKLVVGGVTIPAWTLGLVVAVSLLFGKRIARRRSGEVNAKPLTHHELGPPESVLLPDGPLQLPSVGTLDMQILDHLVRADGASVSPQDFHYATQAPLLRIQQALERLADAGLLVVHRNVMHGPQVGLTRAGRDRILDG